MLLQLRATGKSRVKIKDRLYNWLSGERPHFVPPHHYCELVGSGFSAGAGAARTEPGPLPPLPASPSRSGCGARGAGELTQEVARAAGPGESGAAGKDRGRARMCRICKRFCRKLIRLCIELDIGECVHLRQKIAVRINPRAGIIYKYI